MMEPDAYEQNSNRVARAVKVCRAYVDGMPLLEALEAIQQDMREWEEFVPLDVRESYVYLIERLRPMFAPVEA